MALGKTLRRAPLLAMVALAAGLFAAPAFAATTYTVSIQTDAASYFASQSIMISGTVTPSPGANTAVVVTIKNPANVVVDIGDDPVNPSTGAYNQVTVAGGTSSWIAGTYTVNATWGGNSSTATMVMTFNYSPTTPTTSSTSTTTTTTSTSSTSTSKTTSSSTSTTTTPPLTTTTTSSTATVIASSSTSTSTTTIGTTESGGGLGSLTYVIVAAVAIVIVGLGIVMWRRRVASSFARQSTTP